MERISPALLTFLLNAAWQVALVGVVASIAGTLLRNASARFRHALWVSAFLIAVMLPVATTARKPHPAAQPKAFAPAAAIRVPMSAVAADESVSDLPVATASKNTRPSSKPTWRFPAELRVSNLVAVVVFFFYCGFVLFRVMGLLRAWLVTRSLVRDSSEAHLPPSIQRVIDRCVQRTQVKDVRIVISSSVAAPLTVGAAPPVIVLPKKLLAEIDESLLTSALGHELIHIARRDYIFNFLYRLLYIPLSFHPAAALIKRRIDETRELRCDELVTERLLSATAYARSLVQLAGAAHAFRRPATVAVGIGDADILEERIMFMLKKPRISAARRALLLAMAAFVFAVPCIAAAQYTVRLNVDQSSVGTQVLVPQLGDPNGDAKLSGWFKKQVGQSVKADTVVAVIGNESPVLLARANQQESKPPQSSNADFQAGWRAGQGYAKRSSEDATQEERAKMKAEATVRKEVGFTYKQEGDGQSQNEGIVRKKLELKRRMEEENLTPEEREARQKREREELAARAHHLAELSKAAKITMQQAIDEALRQQQGTVMESSLVGEKTFSVRKQDGSVISGSVATAEGSVVNPMYRIVILFGDENAPKRAIMLISAIDGTVLRSVVE